MINEFFELYEIEPFGHECKINKITEKYIIQLEKIFAHYEMDNTGFYQGFKIEFHNNFWEYQLTYRRGGYFTHGIGNTRCEALIDQLIKIMQDPVIEENEKRIIKTKVQNIFKEKTTLSDNLEQLNAENKELYKRIIFEQKANYAFMMEYQKEVALKEKYREALEKICEIAYTTDFDIRDIQKNCIEVLKYETSYETQGKER